MIVFAVGLAWACAPSEASDDASGSGGSSEASATSSSSAASSSSTSESTSDPDSSSTGTPGCAHGEPGPFTAVEGCAVLGESFCSEGQMHVEQDSVVEWMHDPPHSGP